MKFLLLIAVLLVAVWLIRGARRRVEPPPAAPTPMPTTPGAPQDIVACAQCGVHLPSGEALPGRGGVFCGEAHRAEFEKLNPPQ